jgi:hypothetical protein
MAETIHLTLKSNGNLIEGESTQHDLGRDNDDAPGPRVATGAGCGL